MNISLIPQSVFGKMVYAVQVDNAKIGVSVDYSPTGNCQFYTISDFCCLLMGHNETLFAPAMVEIQKKMLKPMLLIDLNDGYVSALKKHFTDEDFLLMAPYESTNKSRMTLFLIKTNKISTWATKK